MAGRQRLVKRPTVGRPDISTPSVPYEEFEREKGTTNLFLNEGPCDIDVAYTLLNPKAFQAWIWLAAADPEVFKLTFGQLSRRMGQFRMQKLRVFKELERNGFICVVEKGFYKYVVLLRKPRLRRHHQFAIY